MYFIASTQKHLSGKNFSLLRRKFKKYAIAQEVKLNKFYYFSDIFPLVYNIAMVRLMIC